MKNHLAEIDFSFGADWKTILHRTFFPPFTTHLQTGGHTASLPFYSIPPTPNFRPSATNTRRGLFLPLYEHAKGRNKPLKGKNWSINEY